MKYKADKTTITPRHIQILILAKALGNGIAQCIVMTSSWIMLSRHVIVFWKYYYAEVSTAQLQIETMILRRLFQDYPLTSSFLELGNEVSELANSTSLLCKLTIVVLPPPLSL